MDLQKKINSLKKVNKKIMPYEVFISFETTTGEDFAKHLYNALEKNISLNFKGKIFLSSDSICTGNKFEKEINCALSECKYFIVIITVSATDSSDWVKKECETALKMIEKKPILNIIPCRWSGVEISETKLLGLSKLNQLDFKNESDLANKVIFEVKKIEKEKKKGLQPANDPEEYFRRGNLFFNLGKLEDAIKAYGEAIKIHRGYAGAWTNLGVALSGLGKNKDAVKVFDKAIKINPNIAETWYNKGNTLSELGKYKDAVKVYDKAIEIKPVYFKAWYNKGNALSKLGKYEDALKAHDKAIEINSKDAEAWNNKGNVFRELGKYEDAVKAYNKAIEINSKDAEVWYNKACVYALEENIEDSIKCLSQAISLNPQFKKEALIDLDFKYLWNNEDFEKVVD